ncbi:MAG: GNAT family N-acetyltransferase [Eubacteriales bacterium]|nr:GNAT family N-acetyltransferase [Eubacteriales bacterium]
MHLELRTIDDANKAAVELLEVSDSQKQYIASNKSSLEIAASKEYRETARPFAIYADERIIGFTMFAFELTSSDPNDRYWLWRFMIDKDSQGNGYGSVALEKIIDYFKSHGADHILLSTKESNTSALSLYHKYQFAETGEMNDDEIVLRLNL